MQDGSGQWGLQFFIGLHPDENVKWFPTVEKMKEAATLLLENHVKGLIE